LLKNSARETKKGDKLKPRWNGPYLVHADLGKGVYRLYNPKTGKTLKNAVNVSRLTEFHTTDKSSPQQGQSATSSSSHLQSANSSTFSEGELIVVDENARTPEKKECQVWIRDLRLYKIDEHDLLNGNELSDAIIHAAQMLLIKSSPNINGLQNPVLGKVLQFQHSPNPVVQIHHTGKPCIDHTYPLHNPS
jgi:hypothetical protein